MSEQPRKKNGQFTEKWAPTPSSAPALPDKGLNASLDSYNDTGARQEEVLSTGFGEISSSLDSVIQIYRDRQARAEAQMRETTERLRQINDELDKIHEQRLAIEAELKARQERSLSGRIRKLFSK